MRVKRWTYSLQTRRKWHCYANVSRKQDDSRLQSLGKKAQRTDIGREERGNGMIETSVIGMTTSFRQGCRRKNGKVRENVDSVAVVYFWNNRVSIHEHDIRSKDVFSATSNLGTLVKETFVIVSEYKGQHLWRRTGSRIHDTRRTYEEGPCLASVAQPWRPRL